MLPGEVFKRSAGLEDRRHASCGMGPVWPVFYFLFRKAFGSAGNVQSHPADQRSQAAPRKLTNVGVAKSIDVPVADVAVVEDVDGVWILVGFV